MSFLKDLSGPTFLGQFWGLFYSRGTKHFQISSFFYFRGYETFSEHIYKLEGYEIFCAIEKGVWNIFQRPRGRNETFCIFCCRGYVTFPLITKKTPQQGTQVKKWTADTQASWLKWLGPLEMAEGWGPLGNHNPVPLIWASSGWTLVETPEQCNQRTDHKPNIENLWCTGVGVVGWFWRCCNVGCFTLRFWQYASANNTAIVAHLSYNKECLHVNMWNHSL